MRASLLIDSKRIWSVGHNQIPVPCPPSQRGPWENQGGQGRTRVGHGRTMGGHGRTMRFLRFFIHFLYGSGPFILIYLFCFSSILLCFEYFFKFKLPYKLISNSIYYRFILIKPTFHISSQMKMWIVIGQTILIFLNVNQNSF